MTARKTRLSGRLSKEKKEAERRGGGGGEEKEEEERPDRSSADLGRLFGKMAGLREFTL